MKKTFVLILIIAIGSTAFGQQLSLRSQYMNDNFLLNPAVAGTKSYSPLKTTFRKQWSGFEGSPVTQSISFHTYAGKNLGLGGYIFNDVTGPTRRTGMNFSLAYHLRLSDTREDRLSFGLSALLFQNVFDATKLTTDMPNDEAIMNAHESMFIPDANFGLYYYSGNKYYVGFSAHHLIQSEIDIFNTLENVVNTVDRTYYFTGGYNFELGENFDLTPSLLFQFIESMPYQVDVNSILTFKETIWLGASYRHEDAVVAMMGFNLGIFSIGYSYDYSISDIQSYTDGSHEIYLGVRFNRKADKESQKVPWDKRNRLFTP